MFVNIGNKIFYYIDFFFLKSFLITYTKYNQLIIFSFYKIYSQFLYCLEGNWIILGILILMRKFEIRVWIMLYNKINAIFLIENFFNSQIILSILFHLFVWKYFLSIIKKKNQNQYSLKKYKEILTL